jgi:hypothetical protein
MNPLEQAEFVNELCKTIAHEIIMKISEGKIPEEWDEVELRQIIADRTAMTHYLKDNRKRYKKYKNTVLVNNL